MNANENPPPVTYEKGNLYELGLDEFQANPRPLRSTIDEVALAELAATVAELGVLEPVIFRLDELGRKTLVAGERRMAAARKAGLATIPALYIEGNHEVIALIENIHRQNLTPIEEAEGLQALVDDKQYNQGQLAELMGRALNTLSETLSLTKLPLEIRDDCRGDRTIPKNILIGLAKKKQERAMLTAYHAYKAKLAKAGAPRPRKDPNDPEATLDLLVKTAHKLRTMNPAAWSAEEQESLKTHLANLKTELDRYLLPSIPAA